MRLKVSFAKWRPYCLGLNVLIMPTLLETVSMVVRTNCVMTQTQIICQRSTAIYLSNRLNKIVDSQTNFNTFLVFVINNVPADGRIIMIVSVTYGIYSWTDASIYCKWT